MKAVALAVCASLLAMAVAACAGAPPATPFRAVILAFHASTCDDLAKEFAAIADPSMRAVIDGPDQIADDRKSVLVEKMESLLVAAVTARANEAGVIADCTMPDWLQQAEHGFSDRLRATIGAAAYDGNPVIDYQAWLLELSDDLVRAGMGKGG